MHRALVAAVVALVLAGAVGEIRRLTWSDAQLTAHAARAADALAAERKAQDPLARPGPAEKTLRAAAGGGAGLQPLRRRLSDRVWAKAGVLAMLAVVAIFLWRRNRIAHAVCVVTCALVTAGALASLLPALRAYRLVGDSIVSWELVELVLLALLGLAVVVVGMLERTRALYRPAKLHLKA